MAHNNSVNNKTQRLFEYIRQVFSLDLPVDRDVTGYGIAQWWQADIPDFEHCRVRQFHGGNDTVAGDPETWFSVTKHAYAPPPPLPEILQQWVAPATNPTQRPQPVSALMQSVHFNDDPERLEALAGYIEQLWTPWANGVLPQYRANAIYDQLFDLRQRLNTEGDRLEIMWGHLFMSWRHSDNNTVYHPLVLTPMNLNFDPNKRTITLTPSQSTPTKMDIGCLMDLSYPNKAELTALVEATTLNTSNDIGGELHCWDNLAMGHTASRITGLLSSAAARNVNLYEDTVLARPDFRSEPTIYNAPVIFVRRRTLRLWVDDAAQVIEAIAAGEEIPSIICALLGDKPPTTDETGNGDGGELLLPLPFNDQQQEMIRKLTDHFGILVQGPPGTGKSHTIANIVSSLLARGKTVLVTSQTENALRVLRDYLPDSIKSLCVSQLGNDTESSRQLNEAIESIGRQYHQQNSSLAEDNIQRILKELAELRRQHTEVVSQLRQWSELDASVITIDGVTLTALEAAKECSEQQQQFNWFVDTLSPQTEPPLTGGQLAQMCNAIRDISPKDRLASLQYLPQLSQLMSAEDFRIAVARLHGLKLLASETKELRQTWGRQLQQARQQDIRAAQVLVEESLSCLNGITEPWQRDILRRISTIESQDDMWKDLLVRLRGLFDGAMLLFKTAQGYRIVHDEPMAANMDVLAALEGLRMLVSTGKDPASWLTRLTMSKTMRFVYDTVKVDDLPLSTVDRIQVARAYFKYRQGFEKISVLWENAVVPVGAPAIKASVAVQLADVDVYISKLAAVLQCKERFHDRVGSALQGLGLNPQVLFHQPEMLQQYVKVLRGQIAEIDRRSITDHLLRQRLYYREQALQDNAHELWLLLTGAIDDLSVEQYRRHYEEVGRLLDVQMQVDVLDELSQRLKLVAPRWYNELEERAAEMGAQAIDPHWQRAWRWRRLNAWLCTLHQRRSVEDLQEGLKRIQRQESERITQLVTEMAWQRLQIRDDSYRALMAWAGAMKKYGKGTGKYAGEHLSDAARAMVGAIDAVPAWIMPLHRVVQSFPARAGVFDVVIIDEASQCDLRALPVLFRAKKVLIVGDPEQISPSNIGVDREKCGGLLQKYLSDVDHKETFSIDNSIYDICKSVPSLNRILLTEHFRCIPELIAFSNALCPTYEGRLQPLRIPNPNDMLVPAIATAYVKGGFKAGNNINEPEARALVEQLLRCCSSEQYGGNGKRVRTMGVISLLGQGQAKYIYKLITNRLDETEIDRRRIICGDAYAFQGDERDVMFLSMVVAPNAAFSALTKDSDRQRFNVACSRARDQVFLFHSIALEDVSNPECVRYRLLQHYLNPRPSQLANTLEELESLAESVFELEVGRMIIERGYRLIAQYRPFLKDHNYRIDLIVQGENSRVAVECDGDRWHGPERWQYDHRRQCQLERAGWKFWRISGSTFYRDKEKAMSSLWNFLDAEGIKRQEGEERQERGGSAPL
ncbi:disulfide isomerase [Candidatus Magnetobacterium bavaricum]|uniref:Disulfide isomerase n=1 Tax=Candidatus Magnetobacterium bavaricum TaxID=29290 RepID=A0A0F3GVV2_9BACT|nr:disulfide isomerase [Candidatus Magnetobacterium bavaricum]